jgi:hypothetical protein
MDSPVALLSPKVAVAEVLKLAKSLGISVTGIGSQSAPNEARVVTAPTGPRAFNFPIKYDEQTRVITVPGIYVDFVTWQYVPPQTIGGGPGLNGDKWLRMALGVSFDPMPDFWGTVSIGAPTFEWVDTEGATPTPSFLANFFPNEDGSIYYRYIARVYNPEEPPEQTQVNKMVLQSTLSAGIVQGFPI